MGCIRTDFAELPAMLATLCAWECSFGPYHPHVLRLELEVAQVFEKSGDAARARLLLERAVRDTRRFLPRDHELRIKAVTALRDLLIGQNEHGHASLLQRELVECGEPGLGGLTAQAAASWQKPH
jgi:hypothetical protein